MTPVMPGRPSSAPRGDPGAIQPGPERETGEDHELVRSVTALDVAGRIGLGVARRLGGGECIPVAGPAARHLGEDVVRRPVDDAAEPEHPGAGEVLGEQTQDRRPAHDRGLVPERRAAPARRPLELRAEPRDHELVRGHDRDARGERRQRQRACRLLAAHELDDQVDAAGDQVGRRVGQQLGRDARRPRPWACRARPRRRARTSDLPSPRAASDDLAPDRPGTEHGNPRIGRRALRDSPLGHRFDPRSPTHRSIVAEQIRASGGTALPRAV